MPLEIKKTLVTYHYIADHIPLIEAINNIESGVTNVFPKTNPDDVPVPPLGHARLFVNTEGELCLKLNNNIVIPVDDKKLKISETDVSPDYLLNKLTTDNTLSIVNLGTALQIKLNPDSITSDYIAFDETTLSKITSNLLSISFPLSLTLNGTFEIPTTSDLILVAPDNTKWKLKVDSNGILYTELVETD